MARVTVKVETLDKQEHRTYHGEVLFTLDLESGIFFTTMTRLPRISEFPQEVILEDEDGRHWFAQPMPFHDPNGVVDTVFYRTQEGTATWRMAIER